MVYNLMALFIRVKVFTVLATDEECGWLRMLVPPWMQAETNEALSTPKARRHNHTKPRLPAPGRATLRTNRNMREGGQAKKRTVFSALQCLPVLQHPWFAVKPTPKNASGCKKQTRCRKDSACCQVQVILWCTKVDRSPQVQD